MGNMVSFVQIESVFVLFREGFLVSEIGVKCDC